MISLAIIRRQQLPFSVTRQDIGFHPEIKTFLKLGFPIALQDFLVNISFLILCAIVNGIGLEASSGYGIAQKVTAFVMLIPSSLMQSMSAFVAQNVGAGKEDRAKKAMLTGMAAGACIGVFIFALSFFRGDVPSALFTSNPEYIARSAEYLKGFSPEAILTCLVFSYIGYFNGFFRKQFFPDDIKLPLFLIGISDILYNLGVYVLRFFFRGNFQIGYFMIHIIIPELVYTLLVTIVLYFIILKINQRLENIEKRSAKKFV